MTTSAERLHLPEVLDGPWDHAVICTYNANLPFYEQALARKLGTARNRVLLIDRKMLDEAFEEAATSDALRHVNAGYVAGPVSAHGAAHAKFILLTSAQRGRLLVGSGNLTMSGYSGKGEQFTRYDRDEDRGDSHLAAFVAVKELVDTMVERSWVDGVTADHLGAIWLDTPWIYASPPDGEAPVRHNLHESILDQFVTEVGGSAVDRLTVHAPYWDNSCAALDQLLERTEPGHVIVLVQPGEHRVNGEVLEHVLSRRASSWEVRPVQASEPTFLHAKFILAEIRERAACLQGSANLSDAALLRTADAGNIELVNLLTGPSQVFAPLVELLEVSEAVDPLRLVLPDPVADDDEVEPTRLRIVQCRWDGARLTATLDRAVETAGAVLIGVDRVADLELDTNTVLLEPTAQLADLLDRGAPVRVEGHVDGQLVTTPPAYPYRLRPLRSLLKQRTDPEQLRRIAKLELGVDDDIEQLLRQLDDALIIDRSAVWKMAGQEHQSDTEDDETTHLKLSDLDWDQLAKHPKFAQYRSLRSALATDEPTDLQILLSALTARLGELGDQRPEASEQTGGSGEVDDEIMDAEYEELDEDERAERQEAAERAQEHALAQQRRAFGRFVKRFVRGLTDPAFGELVGPGIVTPNFVLFSALLGRLLARDRIAPRAGIEEQLRAMEYFWSPGGYLDTLPEADRAIVDDVLVEQQAHAVTVVAIYRMDVTCEQEGLEDELLRVRDLWRHLLGASDFACDRAVIAHAAAEATSARAEPEAALVQQLRQLAMHHLESEIRDAIGAHFGISHLDVTEHTVLVGRGDRSENQREIHLGPRAEPLDEQRVGEAFATWKRLEPRRGYYRIVHPETRGRALLDTATGHAWWMADRDDEPHDLEELPDTETDWERRLRRLQESMTSTSDEVAAAG